MVLAKTEQGLKIFVLFLLALFLVAAIFMLGISIYANVTENNGIENLPKFPDIKKAKYTFTFKTTGNIILTNKYNNINDTSYLLHGYWESNNKKYIYHDCELLLDEKVFGEIIITTRSK